MKEKQGKTKGKRGRATGGDRYRGENSKELKDGDVALQSVKNKMKCGK